MKNKAVFLDRDGTLNKDAGYLSNPREFQLLPGVVEGLNILQQRGFQLVVVTNQSGIARGYFTEQQLADIHREMVRQLAENGIELAGIFYCPHHPQDIQRTQHAQPTHHAQHAPQHQGVRQAYVRSCGCRKPLPGLLLEAAEKLKLDLASSFMVGDKATDILAGKAAGCRSILIAPSFSDGDTEIVAAATADFVSADFLEAARWIVNCG